MTHAIKRWNKERTGNARGSRKAATWAIPVQPSREDRSLTAARWGLTRGSGRGQKLLLEV